MTDDLDAVRAIDRAMAMQTIEKRLEELLREYNPTRLIILGDLVHDRGAAREAAHLVKRLSSYCNILLIPGNHDHELSDAVDSDNETISFSSFPKAEKGSGRALA